MYGYKQNTNLLLINVLSFGTLNHSVYSCRIDGYKYQHHRSIECLLLLNASTFYLLPIDSMYLAINRTQDISTNLSFGTLDVQ